MMYVWEGERFWSLSGFQASYLTRTQTRLIQAMHSMQRKSKTSENVGLHVDSFCPQLGKEDGIESSSNSVQTV